jgi:hypothetical protein
MHLRLKLFKNVSQKGLNQERSVHVSRVNPANTLKNEK